MNLCVAQEPPVTTQQQLEDVVEALEDEVQKDDNYLQILGFYSRHPLNLNVATAEELQPLRLLTDLQIQNIIQYRSLLGHFLSMYELQAVPTLDLLSIRKIEPYVYVGPALSVADAFATRLKGGEQHLLGRYTRVPERARGYDTTLRTHYLGDPNQVMIRYRYQYKNLLQFGFVADKDAGEQFFKGAQKHGFDFYSAHFFTRNLGKVKSLALGDYLVNMGQGLIQWQSMGFGKSAEVMAIKRQSPTLMPYRSAGEFFFNRGVAATIAWGRWQFTGFASSKKISGNFIDTLTGFSSFQTSGFYRTRNEIADRYNINTGSAGGSVAFVDGTLKLAANTVRHGFSMPLQKRADPYNYFAPSGTEMWNSSIDYSYTYKNIHLFGEAAVDKNKNAAFIGGAMISADSRVDVSLLYRNISQGYQSFYGNAFTESTLPSNEAGLYTGVVLRPVYGWTISAYADFYRFPFMKYRVHGPSQGNEYLVQLSHVSSKRSEIYIRYRSENKPVNESGTSLTVNYPVDKLKQNLRFHYAVQVHPEWSIRSRVEMLWWDRQGSDPQQGFLAYVDGVYKPSFRLSGNLRVQYFETGGYNSRIYAFENDVLYAFSIPPFYDKGVRYYVNVNYDLGKTLSVWLRWAQTIYSGKTAVGTGLEAIEGDRKSQIKFQFIFRF